MAEVNRVLRNNSWAIATAWLQGVYYIITGIWPLVSISTFMAATGPKTDVWLVKTVGTLVIAVGISILSAAVNKRITSEIIMLGILCAIGFTAIDFYYSFMDRISNIYLLDAAAEIALLVLWLIAIFAVRKLT